MANEKKYLNSTGLSHFWDRISNILSQKVDKVNGKGLSTNDYTTEEKNKLNNIETQANKTIIDATLSITGQAADAKAVGDELNNKIDDVQIEGASIVDVNGIASIPIATTNSPGVVEVGGALQFVSGGGNKLYVVSASEGQIKKGTNTAFPITPARSGATVFYGLAKAAGDTTQSQSDNAIGAYTTEAKTAIQEMLNIPSNDDVVTDVQIDSTSILSNGVANIPVASASALGAVKIDQALGIGITAENTIGTVSASGNQSRHGTSYGVVIVPANQHYAAFYGLAKAAGDTTQPNSTTNKYTDTAKGKILTMFGVEDFLAPIETDSTSTRNYNTGDVFVLGSALQRVTAPIAIGGTFSASNSEPITIGNDFAKKSDISVTDVQVDGTSILNNGVAEIPVLSTADNINSGPGLVKVFDGYGITINSSGYLQMSSATIPQTKTGTSSAKAITPSIQHGATFYGLAKAAGDNTQSVSNNAIGTYTDEAKSAIQNMLGVTDNISGLENRLDNKVDKSAIENAGITSTTYTTIKNITVTTSTSETHDIPYAESEGGNIIEKYKYRVTINETEYILDGRLFFKYTDNTSTSGSKGVTFVGNATLYFGNNSGVCFPIDDVPFCLVQMDLEFSGIQIYTETPGTYSIKLERINYTKKEIPEILIYGINEPPIYRKNNGESSYDGFSIGNMNALISSRNTIAIGSGNTISGDNSNALGVDNRVSGTLAIAIGNRNEASGLNSLATGLATQASGKGSFSEGETTIASAEAAHAEGYASRASGMCSHAENLNTIASGGQSHAEGNTTTASGVNSHSAGFRTIANHRSQYVFGERNVPDPSSAASTARGNYVEIVGNGATNDALSNARTLDWDGNERLAGNVYVNCNADSTGGTMLPTDVQINGTSIVSNGVANIPIADENTFGTVKINVAGGIGITNSGVLYVKDATSDLIQAGIDAGSTIKPKRQHEAVFYGLSKVAGVDLANETITLGTYPNTAKTAIKTMLGITDPTVTDVQVNGTSVLSNGVANVPLATESTPGVVRFTSTSGFVYGLRGAVYLDMAVVSEAKAGSVSYKAITPSTQHAATFYGLAKAAGDTTQSESSNAVGTYTSEAKAAIKTMLGVTDSTITDVQVNGTSIVSNGVANIPKASMSAPGVVKAYVYGVDSANDGGVFLLNDQLYVIGASLNRLKAGNDLAGIVCAARQHISTFYGLAKAAGDTTQAQSDNEVGTYTTEAKTAIKTMLGIVDPVTPSFSIGTVTTGSAGSSASATITGTDAAPVLNMTIPKGDTGVYVGSTEPTDPNVNVWIDPNGSSWEDTMIQVIINRVLAMYPAAEGVSF